jgi:hypothetical protein
MTSGAANPMLVAGTRNPGKALGLSTASNKIRRASLFALEDPQKGTMAWLIKA